MSEANEQCLQEVKPEEGTVTAITVQPLCADSNPKIGASNEYFLFRRKRGSDGFALKHIIS